MVNMKTLRKTEFIFRKKSKITILETLRTTIKNEKERNNFKAKKNIKNDNKERKREK